jgi:hypothetical protein
MDRLAVPCILGIWSCRELAAVLSMLLLLLAQPASTRPPGSSSSKAHLLSTSKKASADRPSTSSAPPVNETKLTRIEQAKYKCGNNRGTCVSKAAQLGSPVVPTISPQQWMDRCSCPDLQWLR